MKKENISAKGAGEYKFTSTSADGETETTHVSMQQLIEILHYEISIHAEYLDPNLKNVTPLHKWELDLEKSGSVTDWELGDSTTESVIEYYKIHSPEVARDIQRTFDPAITDEMTKWLALRDAIRDEVNRRRQAKEQKPKRKRQTQNLVPLDSEPYMFMASDKANKLFVKSLMPNQTRPIKETSLDGLEARGFNIPGRFGAVCVKDDDANFVGLVGYNVSIGESVFRFFQEKSALAVKAHFALWARAHVETKANPEKLIKMSISQFCDDLGFKKKQRTHKIENKRRAMQVLEALTSAELIVLWQDPQGKGHRTKGNIWQRGLSDEIISDISSFTNKNNDKKIEKQIDPNTFSYRPGAFFEDSEWRKFNDYVGLVGQGLLKLGIDNKDKAAVLIGGYIAFLARIENYDTRTLKLTTIIENTGELLTGYIDRREAAILETVVENAFDRLVEVNVLKNYEWVFDELLKPSDSDKEVKMPELLARRIKFTLPNELVRRGKEYQAIEAGHRKEAATKKEKAKAEQAKTKRK
jgi:hypothetical protein